MDTITLIPAEDVGEAVQPAMTRVDIPEYNTFIEFPEGTDPGEMEQVVAANFPAKTQSTPVLLSSHKSMAEQTPLERIKVTGTPLQKVKQFVKDVIIPQPAKAVANVQRFIGGMNRWLGETVVPDAVGGKALAEAGKQWVDEGTMVAEEIAREHPVDPHSWAGATSSALESIGQQAVPLAVGVLTGQPEIPLAAMGAQTAGQKYGEYRGRGMSPFQAGMGAGGQGIVEVATEKFPTQQLFELVKKPVIGTLAKMFGGELVGENVATLTQDIIDKGYAKSNMTGSEVLQGVQDYFTSGEALQALKDTTKSTVIQTGLMGGTGAAVGKVLAPKAQPAPVAMSNESYDQTADMPAPTGPLSRAMNKLPPADLPKVRPEEQLQPMGAQYRGRGMSPFQAGMGAGGQGIVEVATEKFPTQQLFELVKKPVIGWGDVKQSVGNERGSVTLPEVSAAALSEKLGTVKEQVDKLTDKSAFVKDDVKPAVRAAGEGLQASWDGIKKAFNPIGRTLEAEEAGRILIEGMGKTERDKEQFINELNRTVMQHTQATTRTAKALDLMRSSATLADGVFARMPENERIDFMNRIDTGQEQTTPELQSLADTIRAMFEEKVQRIQSLETGALQQVRDNYFPHIWERSGNAEKNIRTRLSKRPLEGGKGFTRQRLFDDIMEGINAGYKLVSTNPIDLVFLKMAEMDKYIMAHTALQAMAKDLNGVYLIPPHTKTPEGYRDIDGRYGVVTKGTEIDSETGEERSKSLRYVAFEDVAQVFNNYLSKNLYNNPYVGAPFRAYMSAANTLNQFQLGFFSAFHAGFTSMEAVISHGALGIKALARGDFKEAGRYLKHAPLAFYENPKLGDKVMKAWMGEPGAVQEVPQIVQWLEMAGARRRMDTRFQTNHTQKMLQAWEDGNKIGAGLRTLPALVEQSARPIMEWLVPRQKFGVFAEMANDWYQRHPAATHEETRKAMQQIWNRVDSRLGQVVYDRLFVHNVAKNLAQALIRAPGWTGGTILEVGGGLKDLAEYTRDMVSKGKKAELTDRAAYTLSMLVTTAAANALLTTLFTGEPPTDWKDLIAFRTGKKDEGGHAERWLLPTYMKDMYAYMQQPGTTLAHKTHPMLSLIGDVLSNKDFYGTEVRHPGDNPIMQLAQVAGFTAKAFVPFWMKGTAKEYERGGSVAAMAAPLLGVMPAPSYLNKTAAERLASSFLAERMPQAARTAKQFERSQLIARLTAKMRNQGNTGGDIARARREGKITSDDVKRIRENAKLAPIQVAFKRLSYEEAVKVFEVADEREKRLLRPMLNRKRLHKPKLN